MRGVIAKKTGWRRPRYNYDAHPLLAYSMTHWAYHVAHAPADSPALLQCLEVFFSRHHVLCWIQGVALSRSLRILSLTSQDIRRYVRRQQRGLAKRRGKTSGDSDNDRYIKVQFLERWAVDLTRILGKFGNDLAEHPSSIFKHIPPFCPRDSIIGQQFGTPGAGKGALLAITGISARQWDDNLARLRVSTEEDETASKVRCTGVYFLALVAQSGTVTVFSAETCEELRKLEHGEWVIALEVNATTGSTAVTVGRLTIKVWDISSGEVLYSLTRHPQRMPIHATFGAADTDLAVSYDNVSVVWHDLDAGTETERFFTIQPPLDDDDNNTQQRSCPRHIILSPDHSRVVVIFEGHPVMVWETSDAPIPPRRCLRSIDKTRASEADVYSSAQFATWHRDGESLYITYRDTVLVHWDLLTDSTTEHHQLAGTASGDLITISSDGQLLLTCDFHGTLSVFALPSMALAYRLLADRHSNDVVVRDIALSPDGRRIYDVVGSLCCVWEPGALVGGVDDVDDDDGFPDASHALHHKSPPRGSGSGGVVTAVVYERGGGEKEEFYCCGLEDGQTP